MAHAFLSICHCGISKVFNHLPSRLFSAAQHDHALTSAGKACYDALSFYSILTPHPFCGTLNKQAFMRMVEVPPYEQEDDEDVDMMGLMGGEDDDMQNVCLLKHCVCVCVSLH